MSLTEAAILLAAATLAGSINAIAGGGSLITFPVLVWLGRDPILANTTNTLSLWPGSLAAVWALRGQLGGLGRWIVWGSAVSALGGLAGAVLLLLTPSKVFGALVPWLVAFATLLFALSGPITARLRREAAAHPGIPADPRKPAGLLFQLGVALYGGYFGAGMGIMMLAGLALLGFGSIHAMLVLRNVWAVWINGVAAIWFVARGAVSSWTDVGVLTVGQVVGSWLGAHAARRLPPTAVRTVVVLVGVGMFVGLLLRGR